MHATFIKKMGILSILTLALMRHHSSVRSFSLPLKRHFRMELHFNFMVQAFHEGHSYLSQCLYAH